MDRLSQLKRHGLFDANVPRYTSYPPATHFSNDVTQGLHRSWLTSLPPDARLSVYVHVPFCRRLCWFCACRTQGTRTDAPVMAYVESLLQEIATLKALLPESVRAARVHWGGGTPTLLSPDLMAKLANALADAVPPTQSAEFSVEIDPNEIDGPRLDALAASGMNRASIGVQDFDPEIQEMIGRQQSYEITQCAVEELRARGITSLNADLLYGLPKQTRARISSSMQMLMSLNPDRVALYGYAHVPWMAKRQGMIPTADLPGPEARLALFEAAQELLVWDGYRQIGIDHFARTHDILAIAAQTGHLRRNFQGYTDDSCEVLVGLGASAISRFPQGYVQNSVGTAAYQRSVRAGELPTGRGHVFQGEDLLRARMIEMAMCDFEIDIQRLADEGFGPEPELGDLLRELAAAFPDLVEMNGKRLLIPPPTRPLTRLIARHIDAYEVKQSGHSSAI